MFWFGPLIIGTKAKRFDLVRLISERKKQNNLMWSETYLSYTIWSGEVKLKIYCCPDYKPYIGTGLYVDPPPPPPYKSPVKFNLITVAVLDPDLQLKSRAEVPYTGYPPLPACTFPLEHWPISYFKSRVCTWKGTHSARPFCCIFVASGHF